MTWRFPPCLIGLTVYRYPVLPTLPRPIRIRPQRRSCTRL